MAAPSPAGEFPEHPIVSSCCAVEPTRVVMAVWAIAKLGYDKGEVWDALMPLVLALPGLKAREVANVMWALATVKHCDTGGFNVFASRAVKLLADCNGQDLSNMVG